MILFLRVQFPKVCNLLSYLYNKPSVWSVTQLVRFFRDPRMDQLSTGPGIQQQNGNKRKLASSSFDLLEPTVNTVLCRLCYKQNKQECTIINLFTIRNLKILPVRCGYKTNYHPLYGLE